MPSNKQLEQRDYLPGNRTEIFKIRNLIFGKHDSTFSLAKYEMFYWVNFFQFEDPELERVKDQIIYALWTSGSVFVLKYEKENKFLVGVPAPTRWNIWNQIEEFRMVRIGAGVNSYSFGVDYDFLKEEETNKKSTAFYAQKLVNREDVAVASTSFLFHPWVEGVNYFQDMLDDAIKNIRVNIENVRNSRIVFGDKEEIKKELQIISSTAGNIILLNEGTQIGEWGLGDRTDACWVNYESVIDNFEKFRGIRNIQNEKKERKISVEAVSESVSFEYQERNKIRVIQELMNEIKRIWPSTNTNFTNLVEEIIKENEIFEKGNNKEDKKDDKSMKE